MYVLEFGAEQKPKSSTLWTDTKLFGPVLRAHGPQNRAYRCFSLRLPRRENPLYGEISRPLALIFRRMLLESGHYGQTLIAVRLPDFPVNEIGVNDRPDNTHPNQCKYHGFPGKHIKR